jgi:hypothetical protein
MDFTKCEVFIRTSFTGSLFATFAVLLTNLYFTVEVDVVFPPALVVVSDDLPYSPVSNSLLVTSSVDICAAF